MTIDIKTYPNGIVGVTVRKPGSKFHGTFKTFSSMSAAKLFAASIERALNSKVI